MAHGEVLGVALADGLAALLVADTAGVVRQTVALTNRPFGGNFVLQWDQHRRLDEALEAGLRIVSLTCQQRYALRVAPVRQETS